MAKLFEELTALKKAYDEKLEKEGEAALKEAFKELFDKHPRLVAVQWVQYTPYFNDGDPCYFSVWDFEPVISAPEEETSDEEAEGPEEDNEGDDEDEDYDEDYDDDYSYGERLSSLQESDDEELRKLAEDVGNLNEQIPEDVLESVFGDHAKIKVTREGFDIQEYSHD